MMILVILYTLASIVMQGCGILSVLRKDVYQVLQNSHFVVCTERLNSLHRQSLLKNSLICFLEKIAKAKHLETTLELIIPCLHSLLWVDQSILQSTKDEDHMSFDLRGKIVTCWEFAPS